MSRKSRLDYAFAVGRIKALEKSLIPYKLFLEALEAINLEESLKIIYEAGLWPEEIIKAKKPKDIDRLCSQEREKIDRLMAELVERESLTFYLAQRELRNLLSSAISTGYSFFIDYARLCLDLANIKNFLRFKYRGNSFEILTEHLYPGGFIEVRLFKESYEQSWADLYPLLMKTDYGHLWERSLLALEEKNTFVVMERECENILIRFWRRAKEITFGPEPVLAYAMARQREIDLLRLVIIGRMLQLPSDLIKERMSETYV
ncbi:MAG: V-type ATPase subunit [Candidatus Aminicenantes bacterium]|nr:V-type ATPase subunit [Candidatus Aminicenantes bacterium]